ncbi:MAG: hypothetical protein R2716_08750 [Microthrixaceae bacterium]
MPVAVANDTDLTTVDCDGAAEPVDDVVAVRERLGGRLEYRPTGSITG